MFVWFLCFTQTPGTHTQSCSVCVFWLPCLEHTQEAVCFMHILLHTNRFVLSLCVPQQLHVILIWKFKNEPQPFTSGVTFQFSLKSDSNLEPKPLK